jgi:hypothetical protein
MKGSQVLENVQSSCFLVYVVVETVMLGLVLLNKYYFFDKFLGTCMESGQRTCHKWWNPFWKVNTVKFKVVLVS